MKYYFDSSFSVVTKNRLAKLLRYLFGYYDQFCREVIGDDFENSDYRNFLYPTAEFEYYIFRRHRAYAYQQARKKGMAYVLDPLPSFADFEESFEQPVIDVELSSMQIFLKALNHIMMCSSIVYDHKGMCFKERGNNVEIFEAILSEIISERFPRLLPENRVRNLWDYRTYLKLTEKSDLKPAYAFIFRLLRQKKLDFKYGELSRKIFGDMMSAMNEILLEHQITEILKSKSDSEFAEEIDEDDYEIL